MNAEVFFFVTPCKPSRLQLSVIKQGIILKVENPVNFTAHFLPMSVFCFVSFGSFFGLCLNKNFDNLSSWSFESSLLRIACCCHEFAF